MANPIIISEPKKTINAFESLWNASALPIQYIISNDKYPVGAAVTNYYSEITISVNGSDVATIEQLPDSNNETKVDIRKFIQSALKFIPSTFPGDGRDTNAFCEFSISGFEKYLDNTGTPQSNSIDNGGNIFYSSLSSLQFGSETGGNMYDYVLDSSKTDLAKWMTLFERGSIIDINNYTLSIIVNDPDYDLSIDQFDKNGGLLTNDIINIPDDGVGVYRFNTNQIEFEEDTSYITVEGQKSSVAVTELFPIDVDVKCGIKIPAPTNLILSNVTVDSIQLDWTSNSLGEESGFGIERSLDGVSFSQIGTVGSGVTTYVDSGLDSLTEYFYQVRALGAIPSGYSNTESESTLSLFFDATSIYSPFFRAVKGNNTGALIRRNSDGDQESLLFDDADNFIDLDSIVNDGFSTTLGDWVGLNSGDARTVYDQVGNNPSLTNTGVTVPRFVNAGSLVTVGGKPDMRFGSNSDHGSNLIRLSTISGGYIPQLDMDKDFVIYTVANSYATGTENIFTTNYVNGRAGALVLYLVKSSGLFNIQFIDNIGTNYNVSDSLPINDDKNHLCTIRNDAANETLYLWVDNSDIPVSVSYAGNAGFTNSVFSLGRETPSSGFNPLDGGIPFIGIYDSFDDVKRQEIKNYLVNKFGI